MTWGEGGGFIMWSVFLGGLLGVFVWGFLGEFWDIGVGFWGVNFGFLGEWGF